MKIALCGNPNVGKTTLFNRLTRSGAPVGNWHGVTVEARSKRIRGTDVIVADLPGAYSLTPRTAEEKVTSDGVLFGDYDVIFCVAEVNNLRRNLYILTQIAEAGKPVALIVNMMDEARGKVDLELLSRRLGIPVVGASEKRENPRGAIIAAAERAAKRVVSLPYATNREVLSLTEKYAAYARKIGLSPTYVALKAAERDESVLSALGCNAPSADRDLPSALRYAFIDDVLRGVVEKNSAASRTVKIDRIVLGRLALPIFLTVMAAVFVITFEAGAPLAALLNGLVERAANAARGIPTTEWVRSLISDGVIMGVGAALSLLPQVTLLFLLTAILQDSGYMSRVAFVTDDFFKRFGLSGRAAFSMALGLGCSATAVLSARGIENKTARRRAAFVTPFCPCSARLAVFTSVTAYFGLSGFVVAALYILGFVVALLALRLMQVFGKATAAERLLMEMPPYRLPNAKRVFKATWRNACAFVGRIGSVVFSVSVVMWVLGNFSLRGGFTGGGEDSLLCTVSGIFAPVFKPLGFGNWRAVAALFSGVAAKESVISVITALGGMDAVFGSRAAAVSFLIFTCLYVPCVATLAALARENGAVSASASIAAHTAAAYIASLAFYGGARLYAYDRTVFAVAAACVAGAIVVLYVAARIIVARKNKGRTKWEKSTNLR